MFDAFKNRDFAYDLGRLAGHAANSVPAAKAQARSHYDRIQQGYTDTKASPDPQHQLPLKS